MLEVEAITLCRMIDRLEESGMVERRRDPADRRAWRLFLTDKSKPVLAELRATADAMFEQVLGGLDTSARAALDGALNLIRANLLALPAPQGKETAHG